MPPNITPSKIITHNKKIRNIKLKGLIIRKSTAAICAAAAKLTKQKKLEEEVRLLWEADEQADQEERDNAAAEEVRKAKAEKLGLIQKRIAELKKRKEEEVAEAEKKWLADETEAWRVEEAEVVKKLEEATKAVEAAAAEEEKKKKKDAKAARKAVRKQHKLDTSTSLKKRTNDTLDKEPAPKCRELGLAIPSVIQN